MAAKRLVERRINLESVWHVGSPSNSIAFRALFSSRRPSNDESVSIGNGQMKLCP